MENITETEYLETLIDRYQNLVFSLCYRLVGDYFAAQDLTQETFIRAFQGLDSYQLNRPFRPWLRQIAINTCVNFLQRHSSAPLFLDQPLGDGKLTLADTVASPEDPAREIEWREAGRFLQEALDRLPQVYRLLITLRHQEGMSYREIAEQTGVPLGTVKTHLFRARAALRKEFSTYYAWE